jgi:hypothetical protein
MRHIVTTCLLVIFFGILGSSPLPAADQCKVMIITDPPGGRFSIENNPFKLGPTPIAYRFEMGRTYNLTFYKSGYKMKKIQWKCDCNELTVRLEREGRSEKPDRARVKITANTDDAKAYIDGDFKGETPLTMFLEYGVYDLAIKARKYEPYYQELVVDRQEIRIGARLEKADKKRKMFNLSVNANFVGADVYINRDYAGTTPLRVKKPGGKYAIRVTLSETGYRDYKANITIKNQDVDVFALIEGEDAIRIALPVGAKVSIDGQMQYIQWPEDTYEGSVVVKLYAPRSRKGKRPQKHNVLIEYQSFTFNGELEFFGESNRSMPVYKLGLQVYLDKGDT